MEQDKQLTRQSNDLSPTQTLSLESKVSNTLAKYGTPDNFLKTFGADNIAYYSQFPENCVMGTAPSLFTMKSAYGNKYPIQWLMTQFTALSEFCGAKGKITPYQLESLARKFYTRHNDLKATEIMLFIDKVAAGDFGRIAWGTFDPVAVLEKVEPFRKYANQVEQNWKQKYEEQKYQEHIKQCVPMPDEIRKHLQELMTGVKSPYQKEDRDEIY